MLFHGANTKQKNAATMKFSKNSIEFKRKKNTLKKTYSNKINQFTN